MLRSNISGKSNQLCWASPIVFGPRTLARAQGTRVDLWEPQKA
jgi:hypothetical protein